MKIKYYADPGHGWGKVKLKKLQDLSLLEKISAYSYIRGDYAYLEHDCDLPLFLDAMKKRGNKVTLKPSHSNKTSRIRNYTPYFNPIGGTYVSK